MDVIQFVCIAPDHRPTGDGHLTFHEKVWAFCPAGSAALDGGHYDNGHRWSRIEPTPVAELRSTVRRSQSAAWGEPMTGARAS